MSKPGSTTADEGAIIRVVNLEKRFRRERGSTFAAIDGVSVEVKAGSMVTILGPSGCGKTTLLRCIAGLEQPTGGEIWSGSRLLSSGKNGVIVPPERRDFGMMFQSYAVWPHMSVYGNVSYPLKLRRWSKAQIEARVSEMLRVVGIPHLRNEFSSRLSGGQQQRVALARALVCDPKVILFDEPLSNVDAKVREELRVELLAMQKRIGFAGVYVTHDQEEAMVISDRVVVMREGRVLQEGSPREIYGRPTSRFVASFIGVANLWPARLSITEGRGDQVVAVANLGKLVIAAENVPTEISGGGPIVVVARPEAVVVSKQQVAQAANSWPGVVRVAMFKGAHVELLVEVNGQLVRGRSREELAPSEGDPVYISISPQGLRALPADNDERERKEDHGDEEVELGATEGVLMNGGPPKPGGVPAPIT